MNGLYRWITRYLESIKARRGEEAKASMRGKKFGKYRKDLVGIDGRSVFEFKAKGEPNAATWRLRDCTRGRSQKTKTSVVRG